MIKEKPIIPRDYIEILSDIKRAVMTAQVRAAFAANKELLRLYWLIGEKLTKQQHQDASWGSGVIEQLAEDLQKAFPGISGFSRSNIFSMRAFYRAYEKVQQAAGQLEDLPIFCIPWWHNVILITKLENTEERLWYAQKAIEHGWSRNILEMQIKSHLYQRQGKAITNFARTLPVPQSDMAQQSLKDPYVFDFLTLKQEYMERDVEQGLVDNVQKLLLELGKGFAFVGRQYHLQVDNEDFYLDLLFYHYKLRCFVVVELKASKFDPRDAGQLNFYLSAVDELIKAPSDNPTIGILLCKTKNNIITEYALRDINKPIGVAGYETQLLEKLPKDLRSSLPTVEEFEAELAKKEAEGEDQNGSIPPKAL